MPVRRFCPVKIPQARIRLKKAAVFGNFGGMEALLALESGAFETWHAKLLGAFGEAAHQWAELANSLNDWERAHLLLPETPNPEHLAQHRKMLRELIRIGLVLQLAASMEEFGEDTRLLKMVESAQWLYKQKLAMFHERLPGAMAEQLSQEAFPAS